MAGIAAVRIEPTGQFVCRARDYGVGVAGRSADGGKRDDEHNYYHE
jgi:hypothetical protein